MLIDGVSIRRELERLGKTITGVIHIGAHLCEERAMYNTVWNVPDDRIVWIEAIPELVDHNTRNGNRCYCAVLDEVSRPITFYVTNNGQSSSLLELGTHKTYYPDIVVSRTFQAETQTLPGFLAAHALSPSGYNVWNLDIQGNELSVLKGSVDILKHVDAVYTEVNEEEVYKKCCTLDEVDVFMKTNGFCRIMTKMMPEKWGDALYVRGPSI
jgi:FkbM family methyltransferase